MESQKGQKSVKKGLPGGAGGLSVVGKRVRYGIAPVFFSGISKI
ncbi:hypothetical protein LINPERHAP1_LOCUS40417, partial [Linum perenne]